MTMTANNLTQNAGKCFVIAMATAVVYVASTTQSLQHLHIATGKVGSGLRTAQLPGMQERTVSRSAQQEVPQPMWNQATVPQSPEVESKSKAFGLAAVIAPAVLLAGAVLNLFARSRHLRPSGYQAFSMTSGAVYYSMLAVGAQTSSGLFTAELEAMRRSKDAIEAAFNGLPKTETGDRLKAKGLDALRKMRVPDVFASLVAQASSGKSVQAELATELSELRHNKEVIEAVFQGQKSETMDRLKTVVMAELEEIRKHEDILEEFISGRAKGVRSPAATAVGGPLGDELSAMRRSKDAVEAAFNALPKTETGDRLRAKGLEALQKMRRADALSGLIAQALAGKPMQAELAAELSELRRNRDVIEAVFQGQKSETMDRLKTAVFAELEVIRQHEDTLEQWITSRSKGSNGLEVLVKFPEAPTLGGPLGAELTAMRRSKDAIEAAFNALPKTETGDRLRAKGLEALQKIRRSDALSGLIAQTLAGKPVQAELAAELTQLRHNKEVIETVFQGQKSETMDRLKTVVFAELEAIRAHEDTLEQWIMARAKVR